MVSIIRDLPFVGVDAYYKNCLVPGSGFKNNNELNYRGFAIENEAIISYSRSGIS
jgi:hypothetical protein